MTGDVPAGDSMYSDYQGRTGQSEIPVQKDEAPVEDSLNPVDSATADAWYVLFFSLVFLSAQCVCMGFEGMTIDTACSQRWRRRY